MLGRGRRNSLQDSSDRFARARFPIMRRYARTRLEHRGAAQWGLASISPSSSAHGRRLASDRAGWFSGRRRADS